jgi:DNA modification methylase
MTQNIISSIRNYPLCIEHLALGELTLNPNNPRRHPASQIKSLSQSIAAFGFNVPVLIDGDHRVVAGEARVTAARKLGLDTIPVIRIEHLDPNALRAFKIAENRLSELGSWDDQVLGEILSELSSISLEFDIEATGFAVAEIDLRIEGLNDDEDNPGDVLPATGWPVTVLGDLWQLGDHRLVCGDALDGNVWKQLMGADRAALTVTDPPYNVKIDGNVSGLGKFKHREFAMASGEMSQAQFTEFLTTATRRMYEWSVEGSLHYLAMDWRHLFELTVAGRAVYDRHINTCIWTKPCPGMGAFYRSAYEAFMVFAKGGAPTRNNVQLGRFGRSRSNVWAYPGANSGFGRAGDEGNPLAMHPTVKPLALIADILLDASARGDIVADPFAGSGTILIACEKLGRRARAVELDPLYCDTAIRRWAAWTGEGASRISDGVSFAALEADASRATGGTA